MKISLWRFLHLFLASITSIFLIIASITGIILACDSIFEQKNTYEVKKFKEITLGDLLKNSSERYDQINKIEITHLNAIQIDAIDTDWNEIKGIINEKGEIIAPIPKKSPFIQWITSLHRSLFLHEFGRFTMGFSSLFLFFIAISGFVLIIKQTNSLNLFKKQINENFNQFYHTFFGKINLIPILIISASATFLFLNRFFFSKEIYKNNTDFQSVRKEKIDYTDFPIFNKTKLEEVKALNFPFPDEETPVFTLKLKDKELVINGKTGEITNEKNYTNTFQLVSVSLDLHTGRTNIFWAIFLLISSFSILFFIYSGFFIFLNRKRTSIKNIYTADDAEYILLFGSEMGTSLHFANKIHEQLLNSEKKSFISDLNSFSNYKKAKEIIIFTSTYGNGDAPSNAQKFYSLLEQIEQKNNISVSVVGFGSVRYPHFCQFAKDVDTWLSRKKWVSRKLNLHTINNKSVLDFLNWVKNWSQFTGTSLSENPSFYTEKIKKLSHLQVIDKKYFENDPNFIITFETKEKFTSGDLLAIYPQGQERFYSISKEENKLQLVVKQHFNGIGSGFLYDLKIGETLQGRIVKNSHFHLPKQAKDIILIANGVGIAPFLGMISENLCQNVHIFIGFQKKSGSVLHFEHFFQEKQAKNQLKNYYFAFSKEENKQYVTHLLEKERKLVVNTLQNGGHILICGSINMCNDVETLLKKIIEENYLASLNYYKAMGKIQTDCY